MRWADKTNIKSIVVPAEHGASVMLAESVLAGLWIGASSKGWLPAAGWVLVFLSSQPLKIFVKDYSRGIFTARTRAALWCFLFIGALAAGAMVRTCAAGGRSFWAVMAGTAVLGSIHFWAVIRGNKKELISELFGALTLGAGATLILIACGHSLESALLVWGILAVRGATSVVYVRHRLRELRGEKSSFLGVVAVHLSGLAVLGCFSYFRMTKLWIVLAGILLFARLWYKTGRTTAVGLGIQETIIGIFYVALAIAAF